MKTEEERDALFKEFAKASGFFLVRSFQMSFADAVHGYREIEAEFVARGTGDEFFTIEIKRRIAEKILVTAHELRQPAEVCRDAWNHLLRLGFSNLQVTTSSSWWYADCCLFNYEFAEGIAVLEPLIRDLKLRLEDSKQEWRAYFQDELDTLTNTLHQLQTESRRCADSLILEVAKAIDKLSTEMADADIREYNVALNKLEEDFVARAGDDENRIREIKWRTTYQLFDALPDEVTFASCKACFDELVRLGFDDLDRQCDVTWIYGSHCLAHDQLEAGHAVVDPLLADLRQRLADPQVPDEMARLCRFQLNRLQDVLKKPEPYPREG